MNTSAKRLLFALITMALSVFIALLLGEVITKYALKIKPKSADVPRPPYNTAMKDDVLGWKMTPNYSFQGVMYDSENQSYDVDLKFNQEGFKSFGNIESSKKKAFFIGDSYTASIEVSNQDSYFEIIGDSLDWEVFAYGHAGYGSLQEAMILEKYLSTIQPDVVIWQTCSNDFMDNWGPLEMESSYHVGERRPYLSTSNKIFYHRAISRLEALAEHSSFFHFLFGKINGIKKSVQSHEASAEFKISHEELEYSTFAQSYQVTRNILKRVFNELGQDIDFIAFSADTHEPQATFMRKIFEENGLEYFIDPAITVRDRKEAGVIVHTFDGYHWTPAGHRIIADELITILRDKKIAPPIELKSEK